MQRAKPTKSPIPRSAKILGGLLLGWILAVVIWASYSGTYLGDKQPLRLWMFDIGQGDALLLEMPTGEQLLIDGGPDASILSKLGSVLGPWDRQIDGILLTHPDADHSSGLVPVLERYRIETVYETGLRAGTSIDQAYQAAVQKEGALIKHLTNGDALQFGEVQIQVLSPKQIDDSERNDTSLVLLVTYGQTTVLLMGDAEETIETQLLSTIPDIDVLKVGHHGSITSSTWEFLQQTQPEISLVSAGRDNRHGHPHPIVIQRLTEIGSSIFRTDQDGDILLQSWAGEPEVEVRPLPF